MSENQRALVRIALVVMFTLMLQIATALIGFPEHRLVHGDIVQRHGVLEGHYQVQCVQQPDGTTWRCERG